MIDFIGQYWQVLIGWSITLLAIFSTAVWRFKLWDERRIAKNTATAKYKESIALEFAGIKLAIDKQDEDFIKLREGTVILEGEVYGCVAISNRAIQATETLTNIIKKK